MTEDLKGEPLTPRPQFADILEDALAFKRNERGSQRFLLLPGLRGVGKTTILFQLMNALREDGIPEERILYLPCDRLSAIPGGSLLVAYEAYRDMLGKIFSAQDETVFILVDEAQYDPDWGLHSKLIFDENPAAFIIVTGSSALALNLNPDVARRALVKRVAPLGFNEFLRMCDHEVRDPPPLSELGSLSDAKAALEFFQKMQRGPGRDLVRIPDLKILLERYLLVGGLPASLMEDDARIAWRKIYQAVERIILVDIPSLGRFDSDTTRMAMAMVTLMADSPECSSQKMGQELELSRAKTLSLLEVLKRSELIWEVPAMGSVGKATRRKKRHYFSSPSMMAAVLDGAGVPPTDRIGYLLECAVGSILAGVPGTQLSYDPNSGSADFILEGRTRSALEVGWGEKGEKQVRTTIRKQKIDWGIVVAQNTNLTEKDDIVFVPRELFLAMT